MSISRCSWSSVLLALALTAAAPLTAQQLAVEDAAVSDLDGGFGVPSSYEFSPGQKAYVRFNVRGFQTTETPQARYRRVNLTYIVEAVDCDGRLLEPPGEGKIDKLVTERDRNWSPTIQQAIEIPATPRAGVHNFRVRVQDQANNTSASLEVPFEVQSPYGETSSRLSVQRFQFHASERDQEALASPPTYRAGDSIWGRFLLTGFRTGANNQYALEYGVAVRTPTGRVVLHEPKAAAESRESFYPKTHVPGVISVGLRSAIRPGAYILVLSVTDAIGKQQAKAEYPFRVRD